MSPTRIAFNGFQSFVRLASLALVCGLGVASLDGQGFTAFYSFKGGVDGGEPQDGLIQGTDGRLYGTASYEGADGYGMIFAINVDGTGFTTLHSFTRGNDGAEPPAGLIEGTDGRLYGTTYEGGADGNGTIFAINVDGTGFTTLYSFTGGSDGSFPQAVLIEGANGRLYGTTYEGGVEYSGTIFAINMGYSYGTILCSLVPCTPAMPHSWKTSVWKQSKM